MKQIRAAIKGWEKNPSKKYKLVKTIEVKGKIQKIFSRMYESEM